MNGAVKRDARKHAQPLSAQGEQLSGASSGKRNKCRRPSAMMKTRRLGAGETRRQVPNVEAFRARVMPHLRWRGVRSDEWEGEEHWLGPDASLRSPSRGRTTMDCDKSLL
jgi:hypothetical protein